MTATFPPARSAQWNTSPKKSSGFDSRAVQSFICRPRAMNQCQQTFHWNHIKPALFCRFFFTLSHSFLSLSCCLPIPFSFFIPTRPLCDGTICFLLFDMARLITSSTESLYSVDFFFFISYGSLYSILTCWQAWPHFNTHSTSSWSESAILDVVFSYQTLWFCDCTTLKLFLEIPLIPRHQCLIYYCFLYACSAMIEGTYKTIIYDHQC